MVYDRKPHYFKGKDVVRILKKITERVDEMTEDEKLEIQDSLDKILESFEEMTEAFDLQSIKDLIFNIFARILGTVLPDWAIDLIRWVYENIDVGEQWMLEDIQRKLAQS